MIDMSQTTSPKADQLNYDDLPGHRAITITITRVTGTNSKEQPVAISYQGDEGKPWKPCLSMRRLLRAAWGDEGATYVGRSLTLYGDPAVKYGGIAVGGIRVSHMSHIDSALTVPLTVTRGRRAPFTVKPLKAAAKQNPAAKPVGAAVPPASHGEAGSAGVDLPAPEQNRTPTASPLQGSEAAASPPHQPAAAAKAGASVSTDPGAPADDFPGDRKEPEAFVFVLIDGKGKTYRVRDGAKWADTLCGWIADGDPQAVWNANQEHIKAAFAAPDRSHAERVAAAWKDAP